ncbi:nuclease-related domain-containing protein [Cytobacillus dafuensis]|uniref:nuclease-related domain-containing protein n=1 Tax=Cytobacillus dafuensis TaxID=1742359 RepID=UPI000B09505F|nr:nuclease-related domain-containing protein [Cytobacillus dafuensis]
MIFKPISESVELKLLRLLKRRMNLSTKEKQNYLNLEKGFEGEQKFAFFLENLSSEWIILNDLLLKK